MDQFEWDDAKDIANRQKHGVGLATAERFDWANAVIEEDKRYDCGERRFRAFGLVEGRLFCVAFTPRQNRVRIIMVRPMHNKEARRYGL